MRLSTSCTIAALTGILIGIGLTAPAIAGETENEAAIRRAEAKYEAAHQAAELSLREAEKRMQAAHEQFRQSAAAARLQFMADIAAARAPSVPTTPLAAIQLKNDSVFKNLPVTVPGNTPALLVEGGDSVWSEIPAVARGAVIFVPPGDARIDGVVEFTVTRDVLLGMAASWGYDGNPSGGWLSERKSKQQLVDDGWVEVGTMFRAHKDRHSVFTRQCKKGEALRIRTRKTREPYVLALGHNKDAQPIVDKAVDPKTVVEVPDSKVNPAVEILTQGELPAVLENALLYDSGVSGMTVLRVHKKTPIYVAASWEYDGNSSGQWTQERWMKEDFEKHGWKEIGTVKVPHRGHDQQHTLFVRECNQGDHFRLRSRKYGAPFVFVPQTE